MPSARTALGNHASEAPKKQEGSFPILSHLPRNARIAPLERPTHLEDGIRLGYLSNPEL